MPACFALDITESDIIIPLKQLILRKLSKYTIFKQILNVLLLDFYHKCYYLLTVWVPDCLHDEFWDPRQKSLGTPGIDYSS